MGRFGLIILLAAGAACWFFRDDPGELARLEQGDGFVWCETKAGYFEFDLTGKQEGRWRLIDLSPAAALLRRMGFALTAGVLNEDNYREFQSIRAAGRCPASFLNGHAKTLILAVPDEAARASLEKSRPATGAILDLEGRGLRFAMGEIKGVKLQSFNLGGASALLVDKAEILPPAGRRQTP